MECHGRSASEGAGLTAGKCQGEIVFAGEGGGVCHGPVELAGQHVSEFLHVFADGLVFGAAVHGDGAGAVRTAKGETGEAARAASGTRAASLTMACCGMGLGGVGGTCSTGFGGGRSLQLQRTLAEDQVIDLHLFLFEAGF